MSWVRRNQQGKIEAVSQTQQAGYVEELPDNDPELRAFVTNTPLPEPPPSEYGSSLIERRARALDRKGTVEARLEAINLRMGV